MLFGDILKKLRLDKGITQKQLGDIIGISDRVIGYYEANNRFPKEEKIIKDLANFFGVSTDYLLGRTEDKSNTQILDAVSNNPELVDFTKELMERESMQLLFKQAKSLSDSDIGKIIKIIKAIEDEEDKQNGVD
ncbi:helix-turn-helix domain-containing protein [Niameybacter massiliensis]|uniref:helix-turn-helix domain-containing protein n=1 Tax=Niameybacter massiliensis TaxID=1658108 RepID=UPI0006B653D8|nr:helix-turn-helix transcriptional regulator [Niameybacter massiliensis]